MTIKGNRTTNFIINAMHADIKVQWVAALRSRSYKQGRGALKSTDGSKNTFCCLGVLCDLYSKETEVKWGDGGGPEHLELSMHGERGYLPKKVAKWAGIESSNISEGFNVILNGHQTNLVDLNDANTSFKRIATIIEKQVVGK